MYLLPPWRMNKEKVGSKRLMTVIGFEVISLHSGYICIFLASFERFR